VEAEGGRLTHLKKQINQVAVILGIIAPGVIFLAILQL
jgi:hypothetical protein